jgi:DNA repair protein SbcC/Rad50
MRPVHLSLAGLQSYREKQEVDFAKLSDAGVFGIFGPTGSGKSSILDAMTLALYGKVERAPGGTQGIINQMETSCSVTFTFELSGAARTDRYRVERTYKRSGDASVTQSITRLVQVEATGPVVLADKAKEVDARIQQILGLSMQDFTRAVVLPQGKFAEFLSLKGVERRHMLERLFHLEQYGDALGARVGAGVREADMAVKQAEAEQLGLGNASEEALKEAALILAQAEAASAAARTSLQSAEREAHDKRALWKLLQEREELEQESHRLSFDRSGMEAEEARLQLAVQARRVSHFLKEWAEAANERDQAARMLEEAELQHAQKTERCGLIRQEHAETQKRLAEEEGPLGEQLSNVRQAMALHEELAAVQQSLEETTRTAVELARKEQEAAELLAREQERYGKALALQQELKTKLAALSIPSGRREQLQQAVLAVHKLENAKKQTSAAEEELQTAKQQSETLLQAGHQAREALDQSRRRLAELAGQGADLIRRLAELTSTAEELGRLAAAGEEEEQQRGLVELRRNLAGQLARDLKDGEPCPVCGSLSHQVHASTERGPDAPQSASADANSSGAEVARWRSLLMEAKDVGLSAHTKSKTLQSELDQHTADSAADERKTQTEVAAAIQLQNAAALVPPLEEMEKRIDSCRGGLTRLQQETERWSQELRSAAVRLRQEETALAEQLARHAAAASAAEALSGRVDTMRKHVAEEEHSWRLSFPELHPEEALAQWDQLQEGLRQQEELMARLAKADPVLEQMAAALKRLQEEAAGHERERIAAAARVQGMASGAEEKRAKLLQLLGAELSRKETAELLDSQTACLRQMKEREAELRRELELRQAELNEADRRLAGARQARLSADSALDRAQSHGERELASSGFETAEQASAAILSDEAIRTREERITGYKEAQLKLKSAIDTVNAQIGERKMTEAEWEQCEAALAEARQADETALEQKARAVRDMEELNRRHARWLAIEEERQGALGRLRNFQKLQTVLRGNAFVEFMAMEQLLQVSRAASERLSQLTRRRYTLETDSTGGFIIRDDANGGLRRPVSTLSGGETFLTSLSLALALSAQIQLNGTHPLEFFFLDEGFGTLDPDLLETVVHALEKLHMERLTVGVISHVPELKSRLPRRLVVHPAEAAGAGSRILYETL